MFLLRKADQNRYIHSLPAVVLAALLAAGSVVVLKGARTVLALLPGAAAAVEQAVDTAAVVLGLGPDR